MQTCYLWGATMHRLDSKYSILGMWTCNFCVVALVSCFSLRSKSHWVEMFLIKAVHTFENRIHHRSVLLQMCSGFIDPTSVVKVAEETSPNWKWDRVHIFIKTFPTLKSCLGLESQFMLIIEIVLFYTLRADISLNFFKLGYGDVVWTHC